jgi:hypothetical protein
MIYNLTIATLDGCNFCNKFKDLLLSERIKFKELVCDKDPGFCDNLESYTSCDLYPMAILDTSSGLHITMCLTNDYQQINKTNKINEKNVIIYFHSINTMLDFIKKV